MGHCPGCDLTARPRCSRNIVPSSLFFFLLLLSIPAFLSSPFPTSLPPLSFPPFHLSIHLSLSLSSLPLPSQVTVEYRVEDGACIPLRVHTVVISTQHDDDITLEEQRRQLKEEIIKVRG